jgi:hypothetical protein
MTDGDELLESLGFALLAAAQLHIDSLQLFEFAVHLLHGAARLWCAAGSADRALRRRPERREAGWAGPHRWRGFCATCTPGTMLERPLPDLIGEPVPGDIANVIEDDRGILAWRWPQNATDLLEI